jgi:fucose permease
VAVGAGWRWGMLVLLPVVALIGVLGRGQHFPPPPEQVGREPGRGSRLPRRYWIGWATVTACIAVEFSMTLWTADILRDRFDLGSAAASAGVFTIVGGMCLGRVVGARLALRLEVGRLLYLALAVCGTGFAVFWLTTWAPLALAALLVVGLGISVLYPLGIARAIELSEGQPDKATARGGLGAGVAAGGGPFVLGALADQVGIHGAFLVVPALLALAAIGVRVGTPRVSGAAAPSR